MCARCGKQGNRLYYQRDGLLTPIERIYNRVIVDELERRAIQTCHSISATIWKWSGPAIPTGSSA